MKKIQLTQGQVALVDDIDFNFINQWKWCAQKHQSGNFYAVSSRRVDGHKLTIRMAREVLGLKDSSLFAEHKNGNTLDNRRENLRPASNAQNQMNTGLSKQNSNGFKGIVFMESRTSPKKWQARIRFGGKRLLVGYFATPEEAAMAYRKKALELYGEFVR